MEFSETERVGQSFIGNAISDVETVVDDVPTTFSDLARVRFRLGLKDPGPAGTPTLPTQNQFITIDRYHVRYFRGDGRNTPGRQHALRVRRCVHRDHRRRELGSRYSRMCGTPRSTKRRSQRSGRTAVIITIIAEITFYGQDQTGHEVSATSRVSVEFGNFGDLIETVSGYGNHGYEGHGTRRHRRAGCHTRRLHDERNRGAVLRGSVGIRRMDYRLPSRRHHHAGRRVAERGDGDGRGSNSQPLANVSLRAEIQVGGVAADFGRLSAQSLVTDSSGRATAVYTAPATIPRQRVFEEASRNATIAVTPVGTDFSNATPRFGTLRLLPPPGGVVVPTPQGFTVTFEVAPGAPTDNQLVQFNASGSTPPAGGSISRYHWDFGDGGTATGVSVGHAFSTPSQYTVTLVVEDNLGRSRSTARTVTVVAGTTNPTAVFNFSPTAPVSCRDVFFNASQSTAPSGRQIVAYRWVFGDGTTSDVGPTVTKRYTTATPTTYMVTLTVTDNLGRSATSSPTQLRSPALRRHATEGPEF